MKIHGRVHNGVVVLEKGATLPEGTEVTVVPRGSPVIHVSKVRRRAVFPLVRSKHPGSVHLDGERIAELLEEDDLHSLGWLLARS